VSEHKFPYEWTLKDAVFTKDKGTVFSCFACGGGSSMGYKLAGFDVIGVNEIDPKMMAAYIANHNPKYSYLEPIQTFKNRKDLPQELYNLDILDGSPPCSSFSMAGNREKDWGKEKKFREGQAEQILDDLFFDFIDLAKELQPKIVVAENVKGLLLGNAKEYVKRIYKEFEKAGYYCQHWLLNASKMGVPQRRERVFFICLRKDLAGPFLYQKDLFTLAPRLNMVFSENGIIFGNIRQHGVKRKTINNSYIKHFNGADYTGRAKTETGNTFGFFYKAIDDLICATITSGGTNTIENRPEELTIAELSLIGSFPLDYQYQTNKPQYIIGMSVPPVMIAQIATKISEQWL
jgi:DNA (cytosine-5)-methyltransferase 1